MVNFNIVEGDDSLFESVHDEFLQLYNEDIPMKRICEELNISRNRYCSYHRRLVREGAITGNRCEGRGRKRQRKDYKINPKNYTYNRQSRNWKVVYCNRYYASFKTEELCIRYVELMRECSWDFSKRYILKEKVLREFGDLE